MQYEVIYLKSELPSFSWNDGLFAIVEKADGLYRMCKLDATGQPQRNIDGGFMITCTGTGNKGIFKTSLKLNV